MRVYCAGPMSGKPQQNAPAFAAAAELLRSQGHDVVTPVELNAEIWWNHYGRDFDPASDVVGYGDPIANEFFARDLHEVCTRDAVGVLPGWQQSNGARLEVLLAELLRKVILDATTGERISTTIMQHMSAYGAFQAGFTASGVFRDRVYNG